MSICKCEKQQAAVESETERSLTNRNQFLKEKIQPPQFWSKKEINYQASQAVENCSNHHNLAKRYATAMQIYNPISSKSQEWIKMNGQWSETTVFKYEFKYSKSVR